MHAKAANRRYATWLSVRAQSAHATRGTLEWGGCAVPCALGFGGIDPRKREGDGVTPAGIWRLKHVLYRPDRMRRPVTGLAVSPIRPTDGWCDAPADRNYNRPVNHPYPASAERLWREDHLYDLLVILDHNQCPRVRGGGSAIFMHLARDGYLPTQGCIALAERHLRLLLAYVRPASAVVVGQHHHARSDGR